MTNNVDIERINLSSDDRLSALEDANRLIHEFGVKGAIDYWQEIVNNSPLEKNTKSIREFLRSSLILKMLEILNY